MTLDGLAQDWCTNVEMRPPPRRLKLHFAARTPSRGTSHYNERSRPRQPATSSVRVHGYGGCASVTANVDECHSPHFPSVADDDGYVHRASLKFGATIVAPFG